jgi:hypothetical protein
LAAATAKHDGENCSLPAGFPKVIVSPTAWTGADFNNSHGQERYILILSEGEVKELKQACRKFEGMFAHECLYCERIMIMIPP